MLLSRRLTKERGFEPLTFLSRVSRGQSIATYVDGQSIFAQGDLATAIFYIHKGRVKLSVVSKEGKEAIVAILANGQFFGEGCLVSQTHRMVSATAMDECSLARLDKQVVVKILTKNLRSPSSLYRISLAATRA